MWCRERGILGVSGVEREREREILRVRGLEREREILDGGSEGWSCIGVYGFREREVGFRILDR